MGRLDALCKEAIVPADIHWVITVPVELNRLIREAASLVSYIIKYLNSHYHLLYLQNDNIHSGHHLISCIDQFKLTLICIISMRELQNEAIAKNSNTLSNYRIASRALSTKA